MSLTLWPSAVGGFEAGYMIAHAPSHRRHKYSKSLPFGKVVSGAPESISGAQVSPREKGLIGNSLLK